MIPLSRQYVAFELDGQLYGIDIRVVKEVYPQVTIAPVPLCEQRFRGLVNIRGQIVLVVDITATFGKPIGPVPENAQIIVLKTLEEIERMRGDTEGIDSECFGEKPCGLLVGQVGDVVNIVSSSLRPPPPHMADENMRFIHGVVRVGTRLMVILHAEQML